MPADSASSAPLTPDSGTARSTQQATLYGMVMKEHLCPVGLKSLDLLKRKGYSVDDNWLTSREETDAFKARHEVDTTPQTFIGKKRIGGDDDLQCAARLRVSDRESDDDGYGAVDAQVFWRRYLSKKAAPQTFGFFPKEVIHDEIHCTA